MSESIVAMLTRLENDISISIQAEKDKNVSLNTGVFQFEFEKAILKAFEIHYLRKISIDVNSFVSKRGEKTYVFPFSRLDAYLDLVNDKERFKSEIVRNLARHVHETGHEQTCTGPKIYRLRGFRGKHRRTVM